MAYVLSKTAHRVGAPCLYDWNTIPLSALETQQVQGVVCQHLQNTIAECLPYMSSVCPRNMTAYCVSDGVAFFLCLGFRASYVNIYKENQLDAV